METIQKIPVSVLDGTKTEYKVVYADTPQNLTASVNRHLTAGWELVGSHQAVIIHTQNTFRGDVLVYTTNEIEYSQAMKMVTFI